MATGARRADQTDTATAVVTDALAGDLRVALGALMRRLRQEGTIGDFTRSQLAALGRIEREGPTTLSELARAEGVRPQSMAATVAVLESSGLVSRTPDERDGRKSLLHLTDEARDQFATGRLAREDWLFRAIRTTLTEAEQTELAVSVDLLRRLADAS
ncbi:MarR family winged helix-turn-helix transcriptional regulator [Diaminobutyricibacter sp. McL0618]|uniref:MarR family winged helix-turn-helix transcriptional regulator n=1 Tax=Leifsonia sp. McL0618 TaxID=3415677 RepID=UPI003CFA02E4